MPAGCGNLERAFCALLAPDVAEVEQRRLGFVDLRLWARQHLGAAEMIRDLDQRARGDDLDIRARLGGFRAARRGADQAFVARIGSDRRRQDAGHRRDRPIKPEFAEYREAR